MGTGLGGGVDTGPGEGLEGAGAGAWCCTTVSLGCCETAV